jgi:hypothetical protein
MAFTEYTGDTTIIGALGTNPAERGLTTQEFKDKFDQFADEFVAWFNETHLPEVAEKFDQFADENETHLSEFAEKAVLDEHKAENMSLDVAFARDLSLPNSIQSIALAFKPEALILRAWVGAEAYKDCQGQVVRTTTGDSNRVMLNYGFTTPGSYATENNVCISIYNNANDATKGAITFTSTGFDVSWAKKGNGATGNCIIHAVAFKHKEDL